ncbi:MAG: hypothetical protein ABL997_08275, partial [Planctomycetota bacterium]
LQQLRDSFVRAKAQEDVRELEAVLAQWHIGFAAEASAAERSLAAEAARFVERETVRQQRLAELALRAPAGAAVTVVDLGASLESSVQVSASSLRNAGDGWQLRNGRLEYARAVQEWREIRQRRLEVDAGLSNESSDCTVELELAVPALAHGQRLYVFELRGNACVVFATADDRWLAGIVEGDAMVPANVAAAVQRAVHASMDRRPSGPVAASVGSANAVAAPWPSLLPLAVHRLKLVIQCTPQRRSAMFSVAIDGAELGRQSVPFHEDRSPSLLLYPMQEVAVRSVRFRVLD